MTPHNPAFVKAIKANPEDDQPRLIYADWLEELQKEGSVAWANFIRLSIMQYRADEKLFKGVQVPKDAAEMWKFGFRLGYCEELKVMDALMGRKSHDSRCSHCLMGRQSSQFLKMDKDDTEPNQNWYSGSVWERGFIKELGLNSVGGFKEVLPPLLQRHPIQKIVFWQYEDIEYNATSPNVTLGKLNPAFGLVYNYCTTGNTKGAVYLVGTQRIAFAGYEIFRQIFSDAILDYFREQGIV